jgi:hypothetical protein
MKAIGISMAMAMALGLGTAAAGPLTLGTGQLDNVTAGGMLSGSSTYYAFKKDVNIDVDKDLDVKSCIQTYAGPINATADGEAVANAAGYYGSYTETLTDTSAQSFPYGGNASGSYSGSISAAQ